MSEESNNKFEDFRFKDRKCENHKRRWIGGIFKIKELKDCCKDHLKIFKLLIKYNNTGLDIPEKNVIENQINRKLDDSDSICTCDRYLWDTYYRPSTKCIHPDHDSAKVVNKLTSSKRAATYSQLSYLERRFPERQFIIGGQLCMKQINLINKEIGDGKENANLNDSSVSEYYVQTHNVISFEEIEQSKETDNALSEILSMSPNWEVKKKSIEDLSENSKLALKSKYKRAKQALKEKFSESIVPGQAQSLADILSSDEDDELLESDLNELLNIYKSSYKVGKMTALIFAAQKYTKTVVFSQGIKTPDVSKDNRLTLDINKCNHFLDFILTMVCCKMLLMKHQYWSIPIGKSKVVSHVILVVQLKHVITYYQKFCDESFEPLSEHTFYRILNGFNPSQRKSLAWLDDMTADNLNGFKSLVSNQIITPLNSQEKARS